MTAAEEIKYIETGLPSIEVVTLEVSDGETYTSRKFKIVLGAIATGNEDQDAHINAVPDGTTGLVTINYAGMTNKDITLVLFGRH
jgi:hypothetical protein